ncbi:MAG: RsmD family RNA methyltransferase [Alphaproteobacteria bacterium]|nr:RsmD family RNA methyltransferase [Alphaproteobacteria bacterium]
MSAPQGRPRLTGGTARNRPLAAEVPSSARPTSARVREALFSMVGQHLEGQRVLDAFGGAGLLGLEAWSRGAEVVVVERDPRAVAAIRANIRALGASLEVVAGDVLALVPGLGRFDLVLVDPPYALDPGPILARLAPAVAGSLVLEHDASSEPPPVAGLVLDRRKGYGGTALAVYRAEEP